MFSGIVQEIGAIKKISGSELMTLEVKFSQANQCKIGDSVAINGVCLTVIQIDLQALTATFQAIPETLRKTNLQALSVNSKVNIELSLRYGDPVGGHMVQGHVDGVGKIRFIKPESLSWIVGITTHNQILHYLIDKGFISIDGMSITVVKVFKEHFTVALIPETIRCTIARHYQVGTRLNLEADPIGKYIYDYMEKKTTCIHK